MRFGTMRVVWTRSGFWPRLFFSFSFWRIHCCRSLTESVPTLSLMRCSAISILFLFADCDEEKLGALGNLCARRCRDLDDDAVAWCDERMLHFHRLNHR